MRYSPPVVALAVAGALCARPAPVSAQGPLAPVRESGQSVTPAYEGWYRNRDGTISLSFGYFNRNASEVISIPVGPNNYFSPGPADRGQPTHFEARRHWGVFAVTVPGNTPETAKLTWTLIVRGDTVRIPGHTRGNWEIDALEGEAGSGNTPPVLRFAEQGPAGAGPGGVTHGPIAGIVGEPVELKVWASDDGKARNSVSSGGRGNASVTLRWFKHSGPGEVTFSNPAPRAAGGGPAVTTATFGAPGAYVVRVRANDASGVASAGHAQCCWTNGFLTVEIRDRK